MNQQEQLFTIQQVSTKLNIPKPALRFWEKEFDGIIVPHRTRGGQRRYSVENIAVIEEIKKLKSKGMSLHAIKRKLSNGDKGGNSNSNSVMNKKVVENNFPKYSKTSLRIQPLWK
jgi:MerR family transcriptional regulator/heat shock protein HspR